MRAFLLFVLLSVGIAGSAPAVADDTQSQAGTAVSGILFDYDGDKFATYVVKDNGYVDITFASNTPDPLYGEILNKLRTHPDIKGVLSGKGGPVCSLF